MAEMYVGIPWGNEKITTTTRIEHILGQRGITPDGRTFRWSFSGGAIGAGQFAAEAAAVADHDMDLAVQAAAAIGATTVAVTLGATAATLNQYEDGSIIINDGAGEGHYYVIRSNPAADASATLIVTLHELVREALTTATSLAGLRVNAYQNVVIAPTTAAGPSLGAAPTEIADNTYFWLQDGGYAACLVDGTLVIEQYGKPSTNTAGAVMAMSFADDLETQGVFIGGNPLHVTLDYQYGRIIIGG